MLSDLVKSAAVRRYPVVLVDISHEPLPARASVVAEAQDAGLGVVDVRKELLAPSGGKLLGAYTRREFVDWMKQEAITRGGAVFINPDEVIGSWSEQDQMRFFREFLRQELPVVDAERCLRVVMALASVRGDVVQAEWVAQQKDGCGILAHY
ncbi:MAG: hypothetical protein ACYC6J_08145 [Coriobacteriia bacterium]